MKKGYGTKILVVFEISLNLIFFCENNVYFYRFKSFLVKLYFRIETNLKN